MAEETDLDAGGKRRRPTARDIGILAGREGARHALITMGVDIEDPKSLERFHGERAFTRKEMKRAEDRERLVRKVTTTTLIMAGLAGFGAWLKSLLHIGG